MKWYGFPVEVIEAEIEGRIVQIGVVYEWADGRRQEVWDQTQDISDVVRTRRRFAPDEK